MLFVSAVASCLLPMIFLLANTGDLGRRRRTSIADAQTTAPGISELEYLLQFVLRNVPESFLIEDEFFHFGMSPLAEL